MANHLTLFGSTDMYATGHQALVNAQKLIATLIETYEFERLKRISFLGAVDLVNRQKSSQSTFQFTRADHTLGVCELALRFIDVAKIGEFDALLIAATAVCHDMGHSAFSHSLEHAIRSKNPSISHKEVIAHILLENDSDTGTVLDNFNIPRERVLALATGDKRENFNWLFHGKINIDTLDGIYRFLQSFMYYAPFSPTSITDTLSIIYQEKWVNSERVKEMDSFWEIKAGFYEEFLVRGFYADFERSFVEYMRQHFGGSSLKDFYFTEDEVLSITEYDFDKYEPKSFPTEKRQRFSIDRTVNIRQLSDLENRYIRIKR